MKTDSSLVKQADALVADTLSWKLRSSPNDNAYLHSKRVAEYIEEDLGITDSIVLAAALLHDLIEDSDTSIETINQKFGPDVALIVDLLTRKRYISNNYYEKYLQKIEQNLNLRAAPYEVRVIKCSDKLDNLRSCLTVPKDDGRYLKIPYWAVEVRVSILPMAKATDPKVYSDLCIALEAIESIFRSEIKELVDHYLLTGSIRADVREHLQEYVR